MNSNPLQLKNQVIIVTGAASGIGKETALALSALGAKLVLADYNVEGATVLAQKISAQGTLAKAYQIDVSKAEEVKKIIDWTVENFGTLNGLFNNAGIGLVKPFLEMDPESYHKVIDVDQHSVYYGMYYAAKKMVQIGAKGTFVNNASIYGFSAAAGCFNYNTAKAAVVMMSKNAALELAEHGIRVVGIAPGYVDTPILGTDDKLKQMLAQHHMHKKLITPQYIASVVAFLFTDAASAINGHTLPIDDGFLSYKF